MSARTEFTKRQVFAVMWHKAKEDADDPNTVPVIEWLKYVAWDELFPGHCFRCHGFEDGPCHTEDGGYHECPGCVKDEEAHRLAMKHVSGLLAQARVPATEEMKELFNLDGPDRNPE